MGLAELATIAAIGSAATSLAGGVAGAAGQRVSGSLEKTRKFLEAQELRRKAVDVEAATDRKIRMMGDDEARVQSSLRAGLASQGVDTADTGATELAGDIAARAAREKTYERGQGIQQASDLILGAGQASAAGEAAKRAASTASLGTIIGSVGSALGSLSSAARPSAAGSGGEAKPTLFQQFVASRQPARGMDWGGGTDGQVAGRKSVYG